MNKLTVRLTTIAGALALTSTMAFAQPAASSHLVKMDNQKLDSVVAAGYGGHFSACQGIGNCSGNGGSGNGNSHGGINLLSGLLNGDALLSGNTVGVGVLGTGISNSGG